MISKVYKLRRKERKGSKRIILIAFMKVPLPLLLPTANSS